MIKPRKKFMELAIRKAKISRQKGNYAVGAVLVCGDKVVSASSSRSKRDENPIAHAEALVILRGSKVFKRRHLPKCILYSTHEPCPMCASLAVWAKLKGIVYGTRISDMKRYRKNHGNENYRWRTIEIPCKEIVKKSTEKIEIVRDFMREECLKLFHS